MREKEVCGDSKKIVRIGWKEKNWLEICWFPLIFIYEELTFHLFAFQGIGGEIVYPLLFAIFAGLIGSLLTNAFPRLVNRILAVVISAFAGVWYSTQLVYQHIFKTFLSVYSIGENGADAMEFIDQALRAIAAKILPILCFLLPVIVLAVLLALKKIDFVPCNGKVCLAVGGAGVGVYVLFLLVLLIPGKDAHKPHSLYHEEFLMDLSMEKLGVLPSTVRDLKQTIFGVDESDFEDVTFLEIPKDNTPTPVPDASQVPQPEATLTPEATPQPEVSQAPEVSPSDVPNAELTPEATLTPTPSPTSTPTPTPTPTPIDTSPNVLNIDFGCLAEETKDKKIKNLHSYFASATPTDKNEYTGMFEGYNLIMLTAEGYSQWAVNEEITPTLYKMVHEGFYFENYYTPLWWTSTSDGEFVECTGLIPTGTNSFKKTADNYMPFGFGHIFSELGYSTRAYHNHSYTYYGRDKTHPNLGYDYKGVGNGLDVKKTWPESDLEMMQKTVSEYIGDEKFHTYYMTVSGHMDYTFNDNSMSARNKKYVEHMDLSSEAKAYLACQKELDFALEYLLNELEAAGVADKTVIVLSGDHYPYGLEKDKIDELAGHEVEENFELYKSNLVLYCPGMEPVTVSEPCSALDIVPTVLNLFGVEYDSRLFMGQDIFSTATPLVMFSNQSYITDKVMYNSKNGQVTYLTDEELPEDYVKTVAAIVKNKFNISASIITKDYYSYLEKELSKETLN